MTKINQSTNNLIKLHIAVFLYGFSALFGKLISQSPLVIVFGRVFFGFITLALILAFTKNTFKLKASVHYIYLTVLGILFGIHWLSFFQSVKVSNIAIAVLSFSSFPIFVTFIEPVVFKTRIKIKDVILAFITFAGVLLVIPEYDLSNNITIGVFWGVISAITGAFLAVYSKYFVKYYSGLLICFYHTISCSIFLLPLIITQKLSIGISDLLLIILHGTLFTAIAHAFYIGSLKTIKAQLASIITCLEPVYAILFAALLLNEIPTIRTVLGGLVIISTIIFGTLSKNSKEKT